MLAKQGYRVFAGCLTESGEKQLSAKADTITTIRLDVTSDESVEAAATFLAKQLPDGLNCFVNNAGVMLGGPVEWTKIDVSRFLALSCFPMYILSCLFPDVRWK